MGTAASILQQEWPSWTVEGRGEPGHAPRRQTTYERCRNARKISNQLKKRIWQRTIGYTAFTGSPRAICSSPLLHIPLTRFENLMRRGEASVSGGVGGSIDEQRLNGASAKLISPEFPWVWWSSLCTKIEVAGIHRRGGRLSRRV